MLAHTSTTQRVVNGNTLNYIVLEASTGKHLVTLTVNNCGIIVHVIKAQITLGKEILDHSAVALQR